MEFQLFNTLISAILGAVLAYGGIYFTQVLTNKTERKNLIRDNIKEAYLLSSQLQRCLYAKIIPLLAARGIQVSIIKLNTPPQPDQDIDNLYDKLELIINFYVPRLRGSLKKFREAIFHLNLFENKTAIDASEDEKSMLFQIAQQALDVNYKDIDVFELIGKSGGSVALDFGIKAEDGKGNTTINLFLLHLFAIFLTEFKMLRSELEKLSQKY